MRVLVNCFILVVLLSYGIQSQATRTCDVPNVYRDLLKNKHGVEIFSSPKNYHHGGCGPEWGEYGTCCDVKSLTNVVVAQNEDLDRDTLAVNSAYTMILQQRSHILELYKALKSPGDSKLDQAVLEKLDKDMLASLADHALKMTNSPFFKIEKWSDFVEESKRCSAEVKNRRGNQICKACSGRSGNFYDSEGRKHFEPEICQEQLNVCAVPFMSYLMTFNFFYKAEEVLSLLEEAGIDASSIEDPSEDVVKGVEVIYKQDGLADLMAFIFDESERDSHSFIDICRLMFPYSSRTLVEQIAPAFRALMPRYRNVFRLLSTQILGSEYVQSHMKSTISVLANRQRLGLFNSERRSHLDINLGLQNNVDPFKPSTESPFMKKSDNMFDSFDGAKGSTLDAQYSSNRPMNMSMAFP